MSETKTPADWSVAEGLHILDPDGWRMADAAAWDEPIAEEEFDWRAGISTTAPDKCCVRNLRHHAACDYPACWEA